MVKVILLYISLTLCSFSFGQEYKVALVNLEGDFEVYSPTFYHDNIIVCSNKKDYIYKTILDESGKSTVNIYLINTSEKELRMCSLGKEFRTSLNDGPITFDKYYEHCFISQNNAGKVTNNNLALIEFEKKDDIWVKKGPFIYNNPAYSYTHPALSKDGHTLIFSSNMLGGYGGFDLWKSVKVNGQWSKPINLGSNINSSENEFFPTFINDELYFSSNQGGFGGLDIYQGKLKENTPAQLLSKPINSEFDDFSLIGPSLFGKGYFSSNRDGKDKLWQFNYEFPEFNKCDTIIENNFCYTLYEESAVLIPNQKALLYKWTINGEKLEGIEVRYCFPGPGDYEIILDVEDTIADILYAEQSHLNISLDNVIKPYITCPDTVMINTLFYLDASESYLPYMQNKKYYWRIENNKMIGTNTSYQFKQAGVYNIKLGVIGFEDTIKVNDCVYKTIVCLDENLHQNLNKDFYKWKNQIGDAYQNTVNESIKKSVGEPFSFKSLTNSAQSELNEKEAQDLGYLIDFLTIHPNLNISMTYFLDINNPDSTLKTKVINILQHLIIHGIDNKRVNIIEKMDPKSDKTNNIEFNFNIHENF